MTSEQQRLRKFAQDAYLFKHKKIESVVHGWNVATIKEVRVPLEKVLDVPRSVHFSRRVFSRETDFDEGCCMNDRAEVQDPSSDARLRSFHPKVFSAKSYWSW